VFHSLFIRVRRESKRCGRGGAKFGLVQKLPKQSVSLTSEIIFILLPSFVLARRVCSATAPHMPGTIIPCAVFQRTGTVCADTPGSSKAAPAAATRIQDPAHYQLEARRAVLKCVASLFS
jgi:hypothetical protein